MIKKTIALYLCLTIAFSLVACTVQGNNEGAKSESKVNVAVSFNALKEFAEAVGGDKVHVSTIVPDGVEAHDFEPKAQDLAYLSTADVFVYNGLGMESWAENAIDAVKNDNLIVVVASDGADLINIATIDDEVEFESNYENENEKHSNIGYDPHLWLGLKGAEAEVVNIKNGLVEADPENKEYYEANCTEFVSELNNLLEEYRDKFSLINDRSIVTGHAAFGYLCRDFGITQRSVMNIYASGEPSAQQLIKLVEYCKENNVTTIFAEEMASPAVSQTLANEVGAQVQTIFTMESRENGGTYLERMEENLLRIYESF